MFSKVLVANRGEIAVRIVRALDELGVASVAVYSELDRDSPHVGRAERGLQPRRGAGGRELPERREDPRRRTAAAGAEAIHPGYGFLAENAPFAAGLRGGWDRVHRASRERDRGDGLEDEGARADARRRACRSCPARPSRWRRVADALRIAEGEIGFPVAVKAAGGGGGKGFRVALTAEELEGAFEGSSREGEKFFSDPTVYLERYLPDPRHVEVQVLADRHGNVIHLGERDCSIQRRHQKVIEESPAPEWVVDPEMRERIGEIGVERRQGRGLRRRGDDRGAVLGRARAREPEYFFLEMNTRVQVEHCVTEMTTGIDIVKEGIRAAAGEELSYAPGGRRAARPRDRVPHQRRGRLQELRARAREDRPLQRAQRAPACAWTRASRKAARSRRCTTRWWPS